MSLYVDCQLESHEPPVRVEAERGSWVEIAASDPDAIGRAIAGTGPGAVGILLDGRQLAGLNAPRRSLAGLAVALGRLEPMPTMRVADVLLLGLRAPRPHLWQTIIGSSRARAMMCDDEAQVRSLAGRVGIAEWLDVPAVDLPPQVQALTDVTRALASVPHALVLRRPTWLPAESLRELRTAVDDEQQRHGFAVVELVDASTPGPHAPVASC